MAVDAVRCTTLAPGEVEDLQVELLKGQAGCDVHHVFIYLKHQIRQEQERKCSELAMECEDLKAGGWWCWWLVVVRSWWSGGHGGRFICDVWHFSCPDEIGVVAGTNPDIKAGEWSCTGVASVVD